MSHNNKIHRTKSKFVNKVDDEPEDTNRITNGPNIYVNYTFFCIKNKII